MEKLIACCGLDCAACDARIATINNDNELRVKTAEKWKTHYNVPEFSADLINCTGCREPGAKIGHCEKCEIRNCVQSKNFQTCADCDKLDNCPTTKSLHQYVPEALRNLKSLN
jgi:hypothetical protein